MKPELTDLQKAQLLSTIRTNDRTRLLSSISIGISTIALLCSLSKGNPIDKLIEWQLLAHSKDQYFFPYMINYSKMLLLYETLAFLIILGCLVLHAKFNNDNEWGDALQIASVRSLPIMGIFTFVTIIMSLFEAPMSGLGFICTLLVSLGLLLGIKSCVRRFIRFFIRDKYDHLK